MLASRLDLLIISLLVKSTIAACYFPNGTRQTSFEYLPCSSVQDEVSMCCALNRTNPSGTSVETGFTRDICLPNGVCQNNYVDVDNVLKTSYWRETCSSPGWGTGCLEDICAVSPLLATGAGFIADTLANRTDRTEVKTLKSHHAALQRVQRSGAVNSTILPVVRCGPMIPRQLRLP
jgi:hypothetical protein